MLDIKTDLGDIRFGKSVIEKIVRDAAEACEGRVSLQNYKGKYKPAISGNEVLCEETPEGIVVTVFVVIRFGASIKKCCDSMIKYVHENTKNVMNADIKTVKIIVTGLQSKEIARRHIVFAG